MEWLTLTITLILVLDPFGNIPVLIALLQGVAPERRRRVIFRECVIALGLLLVMLLAGPQLMGLLGLEERALRVAGGVVLMLIALRMLFPGREGAMGNEAVGGEPFIVPIAIPLIAGPSAVVTVVLMQSSMVRWLTNGLVALGLAWVVTLIVLLFAPELMRLLGKRALIAAERLTGLLLTVFAVQMMLSGIEMFVKEL
ncbi:MAG: MarC family protein [Planctomycetota bacterium]